MNDLSDLLFVAALLYFVPTVIAWFRGHHKFGAIFFLNLIFGWSGIGWVALLVYAILTDKNAKNDPKNF